MAKFDRQSEFTGITRNNTLPRKDKGAPLDADEKLRLMYLTGTLDITAEPDDHRSWNGWARSPNSIVDEVEE